MKQDQVQREFFRGLLALLQAEGVSPEQLQDELERRGVLSSEDQRSLYHDAYALGFLQAAVELSGNPCLLIRLGQELGIEVFGSFGFALMSCPSLRQSLELLFRYGHILFRPSWTAHEQDGGLLLRANLLTEDAAHQQLVAELSFSNLVTVERILHGTAVESADGVEMHFSYPKPSNYACYQAAFKAPMKFDCEYSQLVLPAQVIDTPVKTANRSAHVVFHQQCEEMLRGLNSAESTTAQVRNLLIQSAGDFPDIVQVAELMHISERTLRRRLEAESTSFRSTFEEIRDLLAREYLSDTELTVADIAHLLGYSETVNFRRAFLRWNGITPSEYRSLGRQ